MVPRENKNNANAKFGGTNKEYYCIFRNGQLLVLNRLSISGYVGSDILINALVFASSKATDVQSFL